MLTRLRPRPGRTQDVAATPVSPTQLVVSADGDLLEADKDGLPLSHLDDLAARPHQIVHIITASREARERAVAVALHAFERRPGNNATTIVGAAPSALAGSRLVLSKDGAHTCSGLVACAPLAVRGELRHGRLDDHTFPARHPRRRPGTPRRATRPSAAPARSPTRPRARCSTTAPRATGTGPTSAANTRARCRPHHRLEHTSGWSVEPRDDGATVWRTPSGHTYVTEPEPIGPRPRTARSTAPRGPGIRALLTDGPGAAASLVDDGATSPF